MKKKNISTPMEQETKVEKKSKIYLFISSATGKGNKIA